MIDLFVSYSNDDYERLQIGKFLESLIRNPEFDRIIACEKIRDENLRQICLQDTFEKIDYCIFFCSEQGLRSGQMSEEVEMAYLNGKEIIPIYEHYSDVFPFIRHKQGIKIDQLDYNPNSLAEKLIHEIHKHN